VTSTRPTKTTGYFLTHVSDWARALFDPTKETIARWLWPDVFRGQDTSVVKAKQAISGYKKALGEPEGLVDLMVFYCEQAAGFCADINNKDEAYFNALVRMFEPALLAANTLPASGRDALLVSRLDRVRHISHGFGLRRRRRYDSMLAKQMNRRR
jgi:hypothetical protein